LLLNDLDVQVVKGGEEVILTGALVVDGTLVVEAGTQLHTEGPVVLGPTMELEVVLLHPDMVCEGGTLDIIVCTLLCPLCHLACAIISVHFSLALNGKSQVLHVFALS
jgi:hypothetical protein